MFVFLTGFVRSEELGKTFNGIHIKDFFPQLIKPFEQEYLLSHQRGWENKKTLVRTTSDSLWNNHFLDPKMKNRKKENKMTLIDNVFGMFETLDGNSIRIPCLIDFEWYLKEKIKKSTIDIFQKKFVSDLTKIQTTNQARTSRALRINIVDIADSEVALNVTGNINISGDVIFQDQDLVNMNSNENKSWDLEIDQTQNFNIEGTVGDRVSVLVDQNSEADFSWENDIKLKYEGKEDEILKSMDAGNISLSLPATQYVTYGSGTSEGLFGIKAVNQLGPLTMTTILSREQVQKSSQSKTGETGEKDRILNDYDFIKDKYFFIDKIFQMNYYPLVGADKVHLFDPNYCIYKVKLYKINRGEWVNGQIDGVAYIDPESPTESYKVDGTWVAIDDNDFTISQQYGWIRLNTSFNKNDALAITYKLGIWDETKVDTVAGLYNTHTDYDYNAQNTDDPMRMKLLKDEVPSTPNSKTWPLMFKNVYDLGTSNIDLSDFEFKIIDKKDTDGDDEHSSNNENFLSVFNLDKCSTCNDTSEENPDGKIDNFPSIINTTYGELFLPFHMPFAYQDSSDIPNENEVNNNGDIVYWGNTHQELEDMLYVPLNDNNGNFIDEDDNGPAMYYNAENPQKIKEESRFAFKYMTSQMESTMNLGFGVVEGSVQVTINGMSIEQGLTGYQFEPMTGTITFLDPLASDPNAEIKVTYEQNQFISFDQKFMAGSRLELDLGNNNFLGFTALYYNQTLIDQKVDIGYEPLRNFIWDINGKYSREIDFITNAVDRLPFIETTSPSKITFEGEFAQVIPNPNPLGQAFFDDFESAEKITTITLRQQFWKKTAPPLYFNYIGQVNDMNPYDSNDSLLYTGMGSGISPSTDLSLGITSIERKNIENRGGFFWHTHWGCEQDKIKKVDVWPNMDVGNNQEQTIDPLILEFKNDIENQWNGITYKLSDSEKMQADKKYLSIWLNTEQIVDPDFTLHFDIGNISENINNNLFLDTEDWPDLDGMGDGILNPEEDTGLDGCFDEFEDGFGDCTSLEFSPYDEDTNPDPNGDNFDYNGDCNYTKINGTEKNSTGDDKLDGFLYPDTEDLNHNNNLDDINRYYTYSLKPKIDPITSGENNGWKLYNILLSDFIKVSEDGEGFDWTYINHIRMWADDFITPNGITDKLFIAKLELVGNWWVEQGVASLDSLYLDGISPFPWNPYEEFNTTVANTDEDYSSYASPSDVIVEEDEVNDVKEREQSLLLDFDSGIEPNSIVAAKKIFGFDEESKEVRNSFFVYNNLKMHVHGDPYILGNCDDWMDNDTSNIELVFQLALDQNNFYEVVKPIICDDSYYTNDAAGLKESLWKNKYNYLDINLGDLSKKKEGIEGLDSFDTTLHDLGIDSIANGLENGCYNDLENIIYSDGLLPNNYTYLDVFNEIGQGSLDFNIINFVIEDDSIIVVPETNLIGDEYKICGQVFWNFIECTTCTIDDPHGDNYLRAIELLNPGFSESGFLDQSNYNELLLIYTENNGLYNEGEPFLDGNNNGVLNPPPDRYNEEYNIWTWEIENKNETINIRGEPSIDRINYVMFGIQNISKDGSPIKGTVYLNEMRFTDVKKTKGNAMRVKVDINFADLLSISSSFERKDSEFRTLQERLGSGNTTQNISINSSIKPDLFLPTQWGINIPINVSYSNSVSIPKYRDNTDIPVGDVNSAPDSIKTISQIISINTSFKKSSRSDHWWLRYTLDNFTSTFSSIFKNSSNEDEESNITRDYDLTLAYEHQFSTENFWRPLKFASEIPLIGETLAESKLFWSPRKIGSSMKFNEDNNIKLYRNGSETVSEKLDLTRDFSFSYQLTNSLSHSYSKNIKSDLIEFKESTDERLEAMKNFNPGLVTNINENFSNSFSPINLKWLKPSITYSSAFAWAYSQSTNSVSIQSGNQIKNSMTFNPKDFIEIIYKPENAATTSRSTSSRRGRNTSSTSKINIKNPYIRSILKPIYSIFSKFSPISASYNISITNSESGKSSDMMPSYYWRFGLFSMQNELFKTSYDEGSGISTADGYVSIASQDLSRDFSLNSGLNFSSGIIIKFTFINKNSISIPNLYDKNLNTNNKTYSLIPYGIRGNESNPVLGKSNIPFPNWDINWSGLGKLPLLNRFFSSVTLNHNYKGELTNTFQDGIIQSEFYTHNLSPLVGFTFRTKGKNSVTITTRLNQTLTIDNTLSNGSNSTERNFVNSIAGDLSWSKRGGLYIPIFFFRDFEISNDITLNIQTSYDNSIKTAISSNNNSAELERNSSFHFKPEITYSFTRWVNGGIHFDYLYTSNKTTGSRTERDFGFTIKIKIQG